MGRLVKANPAADTSKSQTTVVGTGAHGRLVRTGDVQRTSPAGNAAQQPTIDQKALDAAMERANEKDKKPNDRSRKRNSRSHAQELREITGDRTKTDIGSLVKSAAQGYAADMVGAADTLLRLPSGLNYAASQERGEIEAAKKNVAMYEEKLKTAKSDEERAQIQKLLDRNKRIIAIDSEYAGKQTENYRSLTKGAQDTLQRTYQNLRTSAAENMQKANEGQGAVGQLLNNVAVAGMQMGADAAAGFGRALVPMAARVFGGSSQEAMEEGIQPGMTDAELLDMQNRALLYGAGSAGVSILSEKLSNVAAPFKKAFGSGVLDKAINRAVAKMGNNAAGKIAMSFASEGFEEMFEDAVQPVLQSIYNGQSVGKNYSELEISDMLYDGLVGGILGGLGGAVEAAQRRGYYDSGTKPPDAEADRQRAFQEEVNRQVQRAQAQQETTPETTPQPAEAQQSTAPEQVIAQPTAASENAPQQVTGKLETVAAPAAAAQGTAPQQVSSAESTQAAEADNNMIGVENNAGPQTQYKPGGAEPAEAGEGSILSGGDGGRDAGARAGEQAGVVEGGGSQRAPERSRTAIERQNLARDLRLEKVSSAELGIRQGTDAKSVTVLPENIWDAELQETAQRIRRETGKKTTMVLGTIPIATRDGVTRVRGVWASDGIIIQADNLRVSPGQIASHEIFHEFADQNPGLIQAVERSIREKYGDREFDRIVESYIRNLRGIIDIDENAADYEVEQALLDVKNEILADAYADINAFGQNAGKYREEVRQTLRERGITDSGGETAAATERRTGPPERYSYAGKNAANANHEARYEAERLEMQGVDAETIRQMTGWFRGADRKWRFETDDSGMKLRMNAADIPNYTTLGELVDAPELFATYPDLKNVDVTLQTLEDGQNGGYNRRFDSIELSRNLKGNPEGLLSSLIHEVQHAIQDREGFAKGANPSYWNRKLENGYDGRTAEAKREGAKLQEQYDAMKENDPQFVADMEALDAMAPTVPRGKVDFDTLEQIEPDPPEWERFDARRDQLEEQYGDRVWDYFSLRDSIDRNKKYGDRMPSDLYRDTAGEIEARDTAARRSLSAEERRNRRPDIGNEDTVFADGENGYSMSRNEQDSVKEQLREHQNELSNMKAVATVRDNGWKGMSTGAFRQKIVNDLKRTGYRVDNPQFGIIEFDEKLLNRSLNYIQTDAEAAAYQAIPQVLKRGIEISGHGDHKGRGYDTITIAAPVELNGKRGNMAVVVMKTKGNRYKVHRILTPEGAAFALPDMANAGPNTVGAVTNNSQSLGGSAPAISSASGNSIPRSGGNVKPKQWFSMEEPVEETKTLIAMHNMTEEKLRRTLDLGAWPSPSIAIVKAKDGHNNYGEYSAIFPRETIDPQADSRNHVYGGDAWTPTHDNALVEREVNYAARRAFDSRIGDLSSQFAGGIFHGSSTLGKIGLENETRWEPGKIAEKLANHPEVQAAYLQSKGESLEPERRSKRFDRNYSNATIQRYLDSVGAQEVARLNVKLLTGGHLTEKEAAQAEKAIREVYSEEHANFLNRRPESKEKRIDYYMQNNVTRNRVEDFVRSAEAFYESGGSVSEPDKEATAAKMFEMIAPGGSWGDALRAVKDWVQPQLDGLLGERGVYNGKDTVTDSGRRSFAETHWDYTAENIVKAMNMAADKGANMYGVTPETLAATATPEFRSVDEMHAGEDRLRTEDQDAHDRALRELGIELDRVVDDLMRTTKHRHSSTFDEEQALSGIIAEAAKGKRTASAVKAAFRKEGYTISDGHAASILHLIERAASIPTGYYEAKPRRVVPFTESVAVVAPDNAPTDLLSEMREAGMNVIEYAAGDDADRLEKINSIKDIRFSAEDAAADEALQRSKEESAEDMRRAREEADEALADRAAEQYRKEKWAENRAERAYIKAERDAKREDAGNVTQVQKATKPVAESKPIDAKNSLRRKMTKLFRIPEGAQKEAGKIIDACADHILKNGALTQEERTRFLNRMYESGIVNTDSLMRAAGQYIAPRRIYVDKKTKAAFGDEWNSFRRRAHAAGLNLLTTEKTKETSVGVDALGAQLAEQLPTVFPPGKFSEQELLEHVVQLAEEGQTEHMGLSDYIAEVSGKDFIRERQLYNELEREMDHALQTFAETAKLEIKLRDRTGVRLAQEREEFHRQQQEDRARRRERESAEKTKKQAENEEREQRARERAILRQAREQEYRIEAARRKRENRELRELQQKTLKQLQWLSKNRERAPEEVKEAWDDVLGDIDIYAASAANELHWSEKHHATWGDLRDMYLKAKQEDPNFLPSEELEHIVARLDKDKIADMDLDALRDLYEAAVGLRTEFYNRNKVLGDDEFREFNEVYLNATQEIKDAPKGKKRGGEAGELFDALINDQQLSPMNVMQRMGGWNPDGSFYSMAKQLEQGERAVRDYTVKANRLLEDFLNKHQDWVKKADGQGKDAIWYKLEVPELTKLEMGDKPIFGDTVTVYMTPAQKVHLYLESKNYSNLRHMTGGRKFVDRELYSRGKRAEALDKGTTIKLAPETVKKLVSDLTPEEAELARILEQYYNTFAPKEINRVSNVLLGYDKANTKNYAPIYTDQNYAKSEFGVFDVTAEGVGNLKKRKVSTTPSLNISAFDAFEKHVDQTARYTGMAIPTRNMNSLMNWRGESDSMKDVIAREWGGKANQYIKDLVTEMQGEKSEKKTVPDIISERTFSNYISAVFGFNPSIVLKQLGSIPMGSAYLGTENLPSVKQIRGIDEKLISRYTQELAWRTMGYSMPETKQLKDNPNWTETNKFVNFTFGGGAITAMDGWAASVLWPQAENKVRREHPELEIGTDEQVKNGTSPFYQAVAKEFNDAVARSQSTSDIIHQGTLRRSKNHITRAFTMFKSDSSQTYNAIRQKYGEWQYYKKSGASEETLKKAKKGLGEAVLAALVNAVWSGTVTFAMAALKNGAKRYRDDDDELTAASILKEFGMGLVGDLAGVMVGGEELAEIIGNTLTGEKWYRIETPGLEQLDDLLENTTEKLSSLKEHGGEFLNIMENGGSLSEYMRREGNNLVGWIRDVAKDAATYIPGVPVNNIETYLLGVVRSISPEAAAAYEDAFTRVEKSDLKHTHGRTLKAKTRDLLKDRTGSDRRETADAVAELYDSGYTKALPSATPSSVTIDKVKHKLNAYQTQVYEMAWRKAISGELDEMVQLPVFRRASEEMREKMLDKLYSYASDMAKAAVFDDYEPKTSTQTMSENAKHGLTVAVQIVGEVGKESDPKGLSLPTLED